MYHSVQECIKMILEGEKISQNDMKGFRRFQKVHYGPPPLALLVVKLGYRAQADKPPITSGQGKATRILGGLPTKEEGTPKESRTHLVAKGVHQEHPKALDWRPSCSQPSPPSFLPDLMQLLLSLGLCFPISSSSPYFFVLVPRKIVVLVDQCTWIPCTRSLLQRLIGWIISAITIKDSTTPR